MKQFKEQLGISILSTDINNKFLPLFLSESGAVGLGLLSLIMERKELIEIKEHMKLNSDSVVLIFSTEGNTDPIGYDEIIYDGRNPSLFLK